MKAMRVVGLLLLVLLVGTRVPAADTPTKPTPKEALKVFNDLIGPWRGTGQPNDTRDKARDFWVEKIAWEWQFKKSDVHLRATIEKGKYFTGAELRYLPEKDRYQLTAKTPAKETLVFEGARNKRRLVLERKDDKKNETQRLILNAIHFNRYLLSYEVKPADRATFRQVYQVGATKEGVDFASTDDGPECVVSGGLGTIAVSYKGKTYYVCCSGCRDAFKDDPETYIKEFEARKKKKEGGK